MSADKARHRPKGTPSTSAPSHRGSSSSQDQHILQPTSQKTLHPSSSRSSHSRSTHTSITSTTASEPNSLSSSFWSGGLRRFIRAITYTHEDEGVNAPQGASIHPLDKTYASSSASSYESSTAATSDSDQDESMNEDDCVCGVKGGHPDEGMERVHRTMPTRKSQQSHSTLMRSTGESIRNSKPRPGRAASIGGESIHSNMTGNISNLASRRSSIASILPYHTLQDSIHSNKRSDKNRVIQATHIRQHLTGRGGSEMATSGSNSSSQDALQRRLSLLKTSSTQSGSRRGSNMSTKSQETAVHLTDINASSEYQGTEYESEYDSNYGDDEEEEEDNDMEGYFDNRVWTPERELEFYRHRQEQRLEARKRRESLISLRRGSLLPVPVMEPHQRPNPVQLPEILYLIFQFLVDLTPAEDYSQRELHSCMLVSKMWFHIAHKTMWREIRFKNPTKLELFVDLLKRPETVECLGIEGTLQQQQGTLPLPTQDKIGRTTSSLDESSIASTSAMQRRLQDRSKTVKKIVLHKLKLIEDDQVLPIASWFHNLISVEFYICERLTDRMVVALADNCPLLQYLLMPGCAKITDVGITRIAESCPRVKHLDLRACSSVSDQSLVVVARNCKELFHLNVGRVTAASRVTGASIVLIAKNTNMNTLGLAGCGMTDDAVVDIARYCRGGLHRISLNSCTQLTSTSIKALMQMCPNLAVLEIKQCVLVTDMATLYRFATRRVLVELCPELQKRLVEYKVELAAMNASIQSNNIASTTTTTTPTVAPQSVIASANAPAGTAAATAAAATVVPASSSSA